MAEGCRDCKKMIALLKEVGTKDMKADWTKRRDKLLRGASRNIAERKEP